MTASRNAALAIALLAAAPAAADEADERKPGGIFSRRNLVAWCIVPFDARKRGPEERAAMLERLGIERLAYDWRADHVPSFEEEILALRKRGIELFAFWGEHEAMFRLFEKHRIRPQVWKTAPSPEGATQEERVEAAARALLPLARRTQALGVKLGLYNHGGWGGEPENLVAVCKRLRWKTGSDHVGIVYNFHHGHDHIRGFADAFESMRPYLLCLNLNGMVEGAKPKILAIGEGRHEREMIEVVQKSGYRGPIGILDHRPETDAEETLEENIEGLERIVRGPRVRRTSPGDQRSGPR